MDLNKIIDRVRMATMMDCDGSISFPKSRKSLVMQFGSINREYAELPKRMFGCGSVVKSPPSKNTRAECYWVWYCADFVALRILLLISPYLILKKQKVDTFITYYTTLYPKKKRYMNRQGIFLRDGMLVIDLSIVPYRHQARHGKKLGRPSIRSPHNPNPTLFPISQ